MLKRAKKPIKSRDERDDDEAEEEEEYVGVDDEALAKASRVCWANEGKDRDRLIGKMIRLISQFVTPSVQEDSHGEADNDNEKDRKVVYVRGHKAVNHVHEFLQMINQNEDFETRDLMIQFIKYNGLELFVPVFAGSADDM